MKKLSLQHPTRRIIGKIQVPGSKSEANRLLILKHLYEPGLQIGNLSQSRDTAYLLGALENGPSDVVDVGDAGTAMRFLTAYYAIRPEAKVELRGTDRMHQRPIGVLVDALRHLGASIEYLQKDGFPPLRIRGRPLVCTEEIAVDTSVSSQFISALMMIGPAVEGGLRLSFRGLSVSAPYVYLTARLMRQLGFNLRIYGNGLEVMPGREKNALEQITVEPDWSAASYWFLLALLADKSEIYLPGFRQHSLQGDSYVSSLFEPLGVQSHYIGSGFRLKKRAADKDEFSFNLLHNPDLAQTIAVALAAKNYRGSIAGLQTLRIKETDRLAALKTELEKTGAIIEIGDDYLEVKRGVQKVEGLLFNSYDDHRMAMALAPLALMGQITIEDPEVVQKSYGNFWQDLEKVKFEVGE